MATAEINAEGIVDQSAHIRLRRFTLREETIDQAERSVEGVIATEDPVTVFDMRRWEAVDEVLLMGGCELSDQAVLVDSHPQTRNPGNQITSADVHGSVRNFRVVNGQLHGRLFFASDPASLTLWEKVRDKHVRDLSVGAQPIEQVEISPRASANVGGKTYRAGSDRPMFITTRWRVSEVSVCPRGADPKAKVRQEVAGVASSVGPAIHSRSHDADCTLPALQYGLMQRLGCRMIDPRAPESVRAQQERLAEMGSPFVDLPLPEMCREALRLDGRTVPAERWEVIRAAMSSGSLAAIFSLNVNALLHQTFEDAPDTTEGLCVESDPTNFLPQERVSMGKSATPDLLPPGGTAGHTTISDGVESYRLARYARKLVVDEQDLLGDNLGGIERFIPEMGKACARLRPDLFYAILLSNPTMRDGKALFSADHGNLATGAGSVLSTTSVAVGVLAMAKQTEDGVSLNIGPETLGVPQDLRFEAQAICKASEVRDTTANTRYPTLNPLKDLNLSLRSDNRLGVAGVTHPATSIPYAGLATNWFLAARAATGKTMEVGYLAGTDRKPQARQYVLDKGQWGICWDIKMDIGMKVLDWRGWYWATGV